MELINVSPHPDAWLTQETLIDHLLSSPPVLPGFDSTGEVHVVRGITQLDPTLLFRSKTITRKDPFFIKLGYTSFEGNYLQTQTIAWSGEVMRAFSPRTGPRPSSVRVAEIEAYQALFSGSPQIMQAALNKLLLPGMKAKSLFELWEKYYALTVWVLYIWGGVGTVTEDMAEAIAQKVADLWMQSRRLRPGRTGSSRGEIFSLAQDQKWRQVGAKAWVDDLDPLFFGILIGQLFEVIESAGTTLRQCGHCERFFSYQGRGQRFCSSQCRNAAGMQKARAAKAESQNKS